MPAPIDKKAIWFAGFFDGEGAIMISKWIRHDSRSSSPVYQLRMSVVNTSLSVMQYVHSNFGGSIHNGHGTFRESKLVPKHFKPVYEWFVTDKTAFTVLKRIAPFVILKKERAELAIEYQLSRYKWQKVSGGNNRLTDSEIARREVIYQQMKALNKKGIPPQEA